MLVDITSQSSQDEKKAENWPVQDMHHIGIW